jgi:uncharacterized membrane protein YdbT with pleckstrin-like domain
MASYVEAIVGPGETVRYVGHVSLWSIAGALVAGAVLVIVGGALAAAGMGAPVLGRTDLPPAVGLLVAAVGVAWVIAALIRRSATELAVTNRRVIAKFGLVSRSTIELNLLKVESVRVEQSIAGRLLGYGSVIVVGTGSSIDPIRFIADPIRFRQALQSAIDDLQDAGGTRAPALRAQGT